MVGSEGDRVTRAGRTAGIRSPAAITAAVLLSLCPVSLCSAQTAEDPADIVLSGYLTVSEPAVETIRVTTVLSAEGKRDIWTVVRIPAGERGILVDIAVPADYAGATALLKVSVVSGGFRKDSYYCSESPDGLIGIDEKIRAGVIVLSAPVTVLADMTLTPDPGAPSWEEQVEIAVEVARRIADELILPGMNDADRERVLHDWLLEHARWSQDSPERGIPYHAHNAYGVLVDGEGVCSAYAEAMQLLLEAAGVESQVLWGNGHAWNLVRIGGDWLHLDPGWNDSIAYNRTHGTYGHRFYNMTDEEAAGWGYTWTQRE